LLSRFQSQSPEETIKLAVSTLKDLLQYSSQLAQLAREVGLNSILGLLTSLLALKKEVRASDEYLTSRNSYCTDTASHILGLISILLAVGT